MPSFLTATDRPIHQPLVDAPDTVPSWPGFADTVAIGPGSGDPIGDDQCQRISDWGALDESAAVEGGRYRRPAAAPSETSVLRLLLWPLVFVGLIAALAALA